MNDGCRPDVSVCQARPSLFRLDPWGDRRGSSGLAVGRSPLTSREVRCRRPGGCPCLRESDSAPSSPSTGPMGVTGRHRVRARPGFLFGHLDSKLNLHSLKLAQTLSLGGNGELPSERTEQVGLPLALTSTAERECGTVLDCRGQRLSWMEGR